MSQTRDVSIRVWSSSVEVKLEYITYKTYIKKTKGEKRQQAISVFPIIRLEIGLAWGLSLSVLQTLPSRTRRQEDACWGAD